MKTNTTSLSERELKSVGAVLKEFNDHRLPRLLEIKARVDQGDLLSGYDIDFLEKELEQTRGGDHFAEAHPEFKNLVDRVVNLYHAITSKAIENEKKLEKK